MKRSPRVPTAIDRDQPTAANRQFAGRVVLVTGAGRGIGRAIALALAEEGADVAIHHYESAADAAVVADRARALGVRATLVAADLLDADAPRRIIGDVGDFFGRLDLLVNNAGIYSPTPLDRVTVEQWDRTFAINLRAMFFLCQAAAPWLRVAPAPAIVNLASDGGVSPRPGFPVSAPYAASKAGVIMLTRLLALDLAPEIRVNAVSPGIVESKATPIAQAAAERFIARTPLKTIGTPRDVADTVLFLASDEARFITGQVLSVDGGLVVR
jgi:NAD(P)-dependent dehydrogenase (short-subunit alcohol dehydrogenase family)